MVKNVVCGTLMGIGADVVNIGLATTPTTELAVRMSGQMVVLLSLLLITHAIGML